jgi:hypothetical protein
MVGLAVGVPVTLAAGVGVTVAGGVTNGDTLPPYAIDDPLLLLPRLKYTNCGFDNCTWREIVLPLSTCEPPWIVGPRLLTSVPVYTFRSVLSAVGAIEILIVASAPGLP